MTKRWIGQTLTIPYTLEGVGTTRHAKIELVVRTPASAPVVRDEVISMRRDGPRAVHVLKNDRTRGPVTLRIPQRTVTGHRHQLRGKGVIATVTKNRIRIRTTQQMTDPSFTVPYTVTDRSGHTVWGELTVRRPLFARSDRVDVRRGSERRLDVRANDVSSTGKREATVRLAGKQFKGIQVRVGKANRIRISAGKRVKPGRYKVRYRLVAGKQRSQSFVMVRVR